MWIVVCYVVLCCVVLCCVVCGAKKSRVETVCCVECTFILTTVCFPVPGLIARRGVKYALEYNCR